MSTLDNITQWDDIDYVDYQGEAINIHREATNIQNIKTQAYVAMKRGEISVEEHNFIKDGLTYTSEWIKAYNRES